MKMSRVAILLFAVAVVASHADETNLTLTVDGITYWFLLQGENRP